MHYEDLDVSDFPDKLFLHDVVLEEETHTYMMQSNPDLKFASCTEFVSSFFEKFDSRAVAENLVKNNKKYQHRTVAEVLAEWNKSADYGTMVHEEIENFLIDELPVKDPKSQQGVVWLKEKMPVERYQFFPELLVYSEELGLAGTIDLLAFDKKTKRYFLVDWKTNKKISDFAFRGKKGIRGPAAILPDCHVTKYGLQLSLYQYILKKEYGIDICRQAIVHLKDSAAVTITCEYQKNNIIDMLAHDQKIS